ncbi:MAG: virulence RhuM family protein [Verrucomicrobia bacterium]|nr:virulence RhuM family protein [Verrucomicrobiota bacterium]MBU6446381.1 virulence RhuM family protein [Verrucomicrobiota bacterium]MDE3048131.1 virulence RhuM family protein [Verrucomicrobiota bacterium]
MLWATTHKRLLTDSVSVDFGVLLNRFSIEKLGAISTFSILPPTFQSKIGQNNPQNRRNPNPLTVSKTAAELIVERSDPKLPNMGLTSWEGSRVRQQDVAIAKNYLTQTELEELNQIVVMYLDYAELQAKRRKTITMREWGEKLDTFLSFNEKDLLNHAGKVSAQVAEKLSLERYSEFNQKRLKEESLRADEDDVALLEELRPQT